MIGCPLAAYTTNGDITVTGNSYSTATTITKTVGDSQSGWLTYTTGTVNTGPAAHCVATENRIVDTSYVCTASTCPTSVAWTGNNNLIIKDSLSSNSDIPSVYVGGSGNGRRWSNGGVCTSVCTSWDLPTNDFEIIGGNTFKIRTTFNSDSQAAG